jgi:indolepyruvate ferredoxin oxidoreductase alpha subunit
VKPAPARGQNAVKKAADRTKWIFLPLYARKSYAALIEKQKDFAAWSEGHGANRLETEGRDVTRAVITSGLGGNYYEENAEDYAAARGGKLPARLHIGAYPPPAALIRALCKDAREVLVIEEGQPLIEEKLRGILPPEGGVAIHGKLDGNVVRQGELDPDNVRAALGLPPRESVLKNLTTNLTNLLKDGLPGRPPQLCQGCPHADSFAVINAVKELLDSEPGRPTVAVNSDIGCYTLGSLPPYSVSESTVCMGASIGMARGAAQAGIKYAMALIGDSTFLHSGIANLIDAINADTPMTAIILDNSTVAMTGCQETATPKAGLKNLVLGLGLDAAHYVELEALPKNKDANIAALKGEMEHRGLSVVVFKRECLEAFRKRAKK